MKDAKIQKRKMPLSLYALLVSTFAIGTTEFIIMGILTDVANDLNITISDAGLLVTGYAIGVAIGAPIITAMTGGIQRKTLLLSLMILFIVGNGMCALAPNYLFLMTFRIISAFAHGTFFGVGAVVASKLVSPDKKTQAVSMVFTGVTLANIIGVPLGTFIGQQFGWRASFGLVSFLGAVSVVGILFLIPKIPHKAMESVRSELAVLRDSQVLLTLLMTVLSFIGLFAAFTFISPILIEITGFSTEMITPILFLYGIGLTVGNTVSAKISDRRLMPTIVSMLVLLTVVMGIFTLTSHIKWAAIITIFIWGFASFGHVPGFQTRIIEKAKNAPHLASSLNISAFNFGIAGGSYIGGFFINSGIELEEIPLFGSLLTVICIGVTLIGWSLDRKSSLKVLKN